jgi:hypothetical protein
MKARRCARAFQVDRPLVLINADGRAAEAATFLNRYGADDVHRAQDTSQGAEAGTGAASPHKESVQALAWGT